MKNTRELALSYTIRISILTIVLMIVSVTGLVIFFKGRESSVQAGTDKEKQREDEAAWETEAAQKLSKVTKNISVMIDPGHGGEDPGTMSGDIYEKDIVFDIAMMVKEYLDKTGINVILSREEDIFIDKYDRAQMANDREVDLFVSIHCNYLENNSDVSGIETYYVENADDGMKLANAVHSNILEVTGANDMYVRTNEFVVIKNTNMPAVLVETGYLSNENDVELLKTTDYKKKVAYGIAAGVVEYVNITN